MISYAFVLLIVISPALQGAEERANVISDAAIHSSPQIRNRRSFYCGYYHNGKYEFKCRDGTCITVNRKCDGTIDCPDGSDETNLMCQDNRCPEYQFKCNYGACIDRASLCDGVADCADSSDELHMKCSTETNVIGSLFKCDDGHFIELYMRCDGVIHCRDGSDETPMSCSNIQCPFNYFQCAYGACINDSAKCNKVKDCADGSDETNNLCTRTAVSSTALVSSTQKENKCELPSHPENGLYIKNGISSRYKPGDLASAVYFNVTCDPGYKVVGSDFIICYNGFWYPNILPICVRACKIEESASVSYRCLITEEGVEGTRECDEMEVQGTVVVPSCKAPNYYSPVDLPYMHCENGKWSNTPNCQPECGTLTPRAEPLIMGGKMAERGEVPWHVGIYKKRASREYQQICGGSIINERIVISAAHCFWQEDYGQLPDSLFAVAVGKLYRRWNHPHDRMHAQKSDVKRIILPKRYRGADLNYQSDMAVIISKRAFEYRPYIRPLCLNFSMPFYKNPLMQEHIGKVAGFGLTNDHKGSESPILKVVDMPYVPFEECFSRTQREFAEFITNDKFCAGLTNGTTVCKGDSGGGWAYSIQMGSKLRYYLGGIVSTSPVSLDSSMCDIHTLRSFTEVYKYAELIRLYWVT